MNKLTRLEEEIFQAKYNRKPAYLEDNKLWNVHEDSRIEEVRAAAKVALQWIEKAFTEAYLRAGEGDCIGVGTELKLWLRENNLSSEVQDPHRFDKYKDSKLFKARQPNDISSPPNEPKI